MLVGNELLQVTGITPLGSPSGETETTTTGAIAALASLISLPPRLIPSGASDTVQSSDITIVWNSPTPSVKTQNIPTPTGSGRTLTFIDGYGIFTPSFGAGIYNINLIPASGLIDGVSSIPLAINGQSVSIRDIDPTIGWVVI